MTQQDWYQRPVHYDNYDEDDSIQKMCQANTVFLKRFKK